MPYLPFLPFLYLPPLFFYAVFMHSLIAVLFSPCNKMQKKKFEDMRKALEQRGYEVTKSIGKGAFGEVLLSRKKPGEQLSAVKVISKAQIKKKPFLQKYIDQEIEIMKKLEHRNIVKQELALDTPDFILIVLQFCDQGNLLTYQARLPGKVFPLEHALRVMVEVLKGLRCIHEKNFIHRDIKSENILLKKGEGGEIVYKIADFGFARSIGGVGAKTHCGTEKYMAPEIISNSYYGISVDIWALGVLFYFMLFAEYPFKGHDMKAEISRRCTPAFSLAAALTKKDRLKELPADVEDFFKKIFVLDSKKRLTFSAILKHPLLKDYEKEFSDNAQFYGKLQKQEELQKDHLDNDNDYAVAGEPQDETRAKMLKKKSISSASKHLQRELQEVNFQIQKLLYLRECANQLYDNYSSYLTYAQRLASKFYLLKAEIFYSDPLLRELTAGRVPQALEDANVEKRWSQCVKTPQYRASVALLQQQNMKAHLLFQDCYNQAGNVLSEINIKNFEKGYKPEVTEKTFDELKFAYRSTTSHIFKAIHQNKKIHSHTRNKIKLRLFCCHMINRIFNRKEIGDYFQGYNKWLTSRKIQYPHAFDFHYFKQWIHEQTQENLEKNITHLHKTFF